MSKLIVRSASGEHVYTIDEDVGIGRHPKCAICLHDPMISKRHATVRHAGEDYIFEDNDSSNGSFIDGVRIKSHKLKDGDQITMGKVTITFQAETEAEKLAKRVNISNISHVSQVQDRIHVSSMEKFMPEASVSDIAVLRGDYEKLRLGNELMQHIGLERDLSAALEKICAELVRIFKADRCVVMLEENTSDSMVPQAMFTAAGKDESVRVSESVLKEVRESRSAVLLSDTSMDDRFSQASSLILQGIHSVMCAPILYAGEFLGVVHLDSQRTHASFSRKDLQLLTGIVRYVAMTVSNTNLVHLIEEEAASKAQFERLLSPSVVEQVMSGKVTLDKGGELRNVTILFADIRGFTRMSQLSSATSIVAMLNQYFEVIVDVVFKYDGTVDKYIGDEIMVLFGAPVAVDRPADKAVACALEMQASMEMFNAERERNGEEPIQIGIGINTGEVVVGSMGSSKTMQYTCIGDAVNVASRLTGMAGPGDVMVSETTLKLLHSKAEYETLEPVQLKGLEGKLDIYNIKELLPSTQEMLLGQE